MILPNVSYCEDNNEVHYNPWVDPTRFVAKFNITNTTATTSLINNPNLLSKLEIDGVEYTGNDIFSHYNHQFDTTGIHTVKYTFVDGTTSIDSSSFASKGNMISITIPYTITTLGSNAFSGCLNLTDVTIPYTVTSLNGAFSNCTSLRNITIPDSVTTIGDYSFAGNTSLRTITFGSGLTSIGAYAFSGCINLTNVTFPNGLTTIGDVAFIDCKKLKSITIPNSVTTIGSGAFCGLDFEDVVFETINPNATFIVDSTNKVLVNSTNTLIQGFNNTIAIPNNVTSIGQDAFYYCSGLTTITIPDSVTSIGNYAFYGCSGLTTITIGSGVTSFGSYAFANCDALTSITIDNNNIYCDSRNNCNAIIETSTNTLIFGCKNTVIPNSVTTIRIHAFYYCSGLTTITIPDSVTSIGNYAFYACSGLTTITIGNGITSIGGYAFQSCSKLTSVTIEATTPPTSDYSVFDSNASGRKIYVPAASVAAYQAASGWRAYAADIEAIPSE